MKLSAPCCTAGRFELAKIDHLHRSIATEFSGRGKALAAEQRIEATSEQKRDERVSQSEISELIPMPSSSIPYLNRGAPAPC